MDKRYEHYCFADRLFYDAPRVSNAPEFEIATRELPAGWRRIPDEEWTTYAPPAERTPAQGWKVHVSGCAESAEQVLNASWKYCLANDICFKHLRGPKTLMLRNAKYAPRGGSGKLVTIYPADEKELERVLNELGALLDGVPGPYILSDLRIGEGPLFVRYGAFGQRHCLDADGEIVPALENAAGELVPDRRTPVFTVPDWVTVPDCLRPHLTARTAASTADLPYRVDRALHFSNGGGVYAATDTRTGEQVVLKEGRPYAGLSGDGADAVTRLERERAMLTRLAGVPGVPGVRDHFTLGGHSFLVLEFIEGRPLNSFFAERHPMIDPEPTPEQFAGYTAWARRVLDGVEQVVAGIHERGVVVNDLHMFNIMVRPDDSVALIDFEVAALIEENRRQALASPAFAAPADRRGLDVDRYSLACLRLALFMPLTMLLVFDRGKARQLADLAAERFPLPPGFLDGAVAEITRGVSPRPAPRLDPADWEHARTRLSRAVLASATPDRTDRLFPGDIVQFHGAALGVAHGAAGVLHALHATGAGRFPEHEAWLLRRVADPPPGVGLGLYDGLLGAAHVLAEFGHLDAAHDLAGRCLGERWERLGTDLYGGLPGWALVLDHLADRTGDRDLRDAAQRAADLVTERRDAPRRPRPGLLYGESGAALMYLRRYERTGDAALLDLAAAALRRDLAGCVVDRNDALQADEGFRKLPYIRRGSVGIGLVLDDYLALRPDGPDGEFTTARDRIRRAALSHFYGQPGLFSGRAGMLLHLARQDAGDDRAARHIRDLAWHALPYEGGLAFPGDQLYRLSTDLATGTAGVLLALGAALHDRPVTLPFLAAHRPPARSDAGSASTPGGR
ncbi:lantipeptide synthetase [Actinomadura craniellae]|uniref:non-specific serine/threonine protein kinase n=1 Tax=Actinomadura craniellae TaxID=2231787 RepID=A0A365H321_9ACTN|nr:class III lanthionine synthetase LanKC [Actinomadura craniellae]RAY13504.1 lantipeptide synthetase [Actinomadura craniellae]